MTQSGRRLLKFIARANGRTRVDMAEMLGCSLATVTRYRKDAIVLGVVITTSRVGPGLPVYTVRDFGPFDINKLRQVALREREF